MTAISRNSPHKSAQRAAQIRTLLSTSDPFLSLAQISVRTKIPLHTLSRAVSGGRLQALIMPDGRRYVAWSDAEKFSTELRIKQGQKSYVLLRLAELSAKQKIQDLPSDFSTNHDHYLHSA